MKASRRRLFARRDASTRRKACKSACHRTAAEVDVQGTVTSSRGAILHAIGSKEDARSVAGAHAVDWCHDGNFSARCFTHGPMAYWRIRPSIGFGRIAMTNCVSSQADGVWAMPSARALLVALLLTEPPFVCLGPSGNDRYRKRSEAVWASRVGCRVAAAFSGTGGREITMDLEDEGKIKRTFVRASLCSSSCCLHIVFSNFSGVARRCARAAIAVFSLASNAPGGTIRHVRVIGGVCLRLRTSFDARMHRPNLRSCRSCFVLRLS